MRRPAQPDRAAPQRCGAALFFSAGTGRAANKKAPEGLRDPPGRGSGVRARCRQHHACAQHQVCQPAAGAGLDQLGILHRREHRGLRSGSGGRGGSGVRSCILHHGQHRSLGGGSPHLLVQLLQRLQIPAGEGTVDPEHLPVAQPEDAAGFLQAGGHPLQREHPAQPCQQHHGAHRTASLNLFSLPLFHPASPVFCAVPRCFFSIISHPRCNLPESRGECTSVPLASALKTV